MSDRISESERAAIAAYLARGGKIVRCPDGEAIGADSTWLLGGEVVCLDAWLAERGLSFTPLPKTNDWIGVTAFPNTHENRCGYSGPKPKAA